MNKILLLLIMPILASANYTFYVDNPEMVDSYFNIFNAIAMVFSNSGYMDLLRLVFLFGGFFVFLGAILKGFGSSEGGGGLVKRYTAYTLTGFALLSVVFSQKTTMWVQANNIPSYCADSSPTTGTAIDNIPSSLAYVFATINTTGKELTRMAETAFSVPSATGNTSMSDTGKFLGSLKQNIEMLSIDLSKTGDSTAQESVLTVLNNCIYIPFSAQGLQGKQELKNLHESNNIALYLQDLYGSNRTIGDVAARDYTAPYFGDTWTCGALYDNMVAPALEEYKSKVACSTNIGGGAVQLLTRKVDAPITEFQDIVLQTALISSLEQSKTELGIGVTGLNYATGKTKAEFYQSSMGTGAFMAEMLPYLQMTLRGVLYAFFPFVFVVVMLPGGIGVMKNYLQTLMWIELWTPTAAIVNMFVVTHTQSKLSPIYTEQGVTLLNSIDMLSTSSTIAGASAYLYVSIPALTWLILKGGGEMLGGVYQAIGARLASNLSTESISADQAKLEQSRAVSEKLGKTISYGESLHYMNRQKGMEEGTAIATKYANGDEAIKNASYYGTQKTFSSLAAKQAVMGGKTDNVISTESMSDASNLLQTKGTLDTSSPDSFYLSGVKGGAEKNADGNVVKTHGAGAIEATSTYGQSKTIITTDEESKTLQGMGGVEQNLRSKTRFDTTVGHGSVNIKEGLAGSVETAAGIAIAGEGMNFSTLQGKTATTGLNETYDAGVLDGLNTNANSKNLGKHGSDMIFGNTVDKLNEETISQNVRYSEMGKTPSGKDAFITQGSKQKFEADENANFLRSDLNGDGKVSDKEIKKLAGANTTENQLQTVEKIIGQKEDEQIGNDLKGAKVKQVQETLKDVDGLVGNKKLLNKAKSRAVKTAVDKNVGSFNQRKDMKTAQDLNGQGYQGEDIAPKDVKNQVQDLNQARSEADTLQKELSGVIGQYRGLANNAANEALKQNPILGDKAKLNANRIMLNNLAQKGIGSEQLTKSVIGQEIKEINSDREKAFGKALNKNFSKNELGALKGYNALKGKLNDAIASGDKTTEANARNALKIMESRNDMKALNAKLHNVAGAVDSHFNEKIHGVYNKYQNAGLVKIGSNGQVSYLDTQKALQTAKGDQKMYLTAKVNGALKGLSASTNDLEGMERKWVKDIMGNNTTNVATATQEWTKKGNFQNDILYHVAQGEYVDRSTIATTNTVLNAVKNIAGVQTSAREFLRK